MTIPQDLTIPPGGDVQSWWSPAARGKPFPFKVYRAPRVTGLEPDVAMPGQEILIQGQNLDGKPLTVNVGGLPAEIKEAAGQRSRGGAAASHGPGTGRPRHRPDRPRLRQARRPALGYLPLVMSVAPDKGEAGEKVVIKGRGFDADAEDNEVYFANQPALILAASETELIVVAPAAVSTSTPRRPPRCT